MVKEQFVPVESLFENMASGKHYAYLTARTTDDMENLFKDIKMPFHVVSSYGMNGRHYALVIFTRKIKKTKRNKGE